MFGDPVFGPGPCAVENGDVVSTTEQVPGHGIAHDPETDERVRKGQREILSAMAAEFRAGARAGHFSCPDPEFTAAYLFGGILEVVEWNLFIAARPLDPHALARKVTDLQLRVLLPQAGDEADRTGALAVKGER